jgi:ADP-ribose diphosphatase
MTIGPWVEVLSETEDYSYKGLFAVVRARLRYRRFDGEMSDEIERVSFERGDSVAVLLYDRQADAVILVRQFRYPAYAAIAAAERGGEGAKRAWTLEIVAGIQTGVRGLEEVAHQELLEEAGYTLSGELRPIASILPSPGGSSERIHIFLGEVDHRDMSGPGGGVAEEGEDVQIEVIPFAEAMSMVAGGQISDAKTIVALQHVALLKAGTAPR